MDVDGCKTHRCRTFSFSLILDIQTLCSDWCHHVSPFVELLLVIPVAVIVFRGQSSFIWGSPDLKEMDGFSGGQYILIKCHEEYLEQRRKCGDDES